MVAVINSSLQQLSAYAADKLEFVEKGRRFYEEKRRYGKL